MRKYKTFCVNCGKETRNTKKDFTKPIDYCRVCINLADSERKKKEKEALASPPTTKVMGIRSETIL